MTELNLAQFDIHVYYINRILRYITYITLIDIYIYVCIAHICGI